MRQFLLIDFYQCKIGVGITAEHARRSLQSATQHHVDSRCAFDDVIVRQHEPIGRHDDTRSRTACSTAVAIAGDLDVGHGGRSALDGIGDGLTVGIEQAAV